MSGKGPASRILYQTDRLRVVANTISSPIRFVSFNHFLYREAPPHFWGDSFFAKYGLGAIGFVATRPDWFPAEEMRRAVAAIRPALARAPGERLVSYGVSMGAYAALKYAALLGVDAAIAFSPQISIAPADAARFDSRFRRFHDPALHAGMSVRAADLAPQNHLLYDNFWAVDRKHAELIAALGPVERFALPLTGHASIRALAEGHIAEPFLLRLLGPTPGRAAELRAMLRRTRRATPVYWESRAAVLTARRPGATRTILHAVATALSLAPNTVGLRLALVIALLDCGEHAEAERAFEQVALGARSPVDEWLRAIECHRRIHGDPATLAMMGRAAAELCRHPAFRFEDAAIRLDMGDKASAAAILELIWPAQEKITRRAKLGFMLGRVGERKKALFVFRALAGEAPNAGNLILLAAALAEDKAAPASRAEALSRLAEARAVIDPEPALWRRVLLLYERLEAPEEQLAAAREALAVLPGYPDLRMELAIALERAGAPAAALAIAARLALEPARIRRLDWLILMLRRGGMTAEAFSIARAAARERPADSASRLQLAVLFLAADEEDEAFAHLLEVRAHPPARPDLLEDALAAFAAVGLHADAAHAAARRAAAHEDQLAPQLELAERLVRAGRPQDAGKLLARVRQRLGNDPASLIAIAAAYARAGQDFRAEELLARALADGDEPATARMQLIALRAKHAGWLGRRAARRSARRFAVSASPDPAFWSALADLFTALGQSSRALAAIGRAVALAPASPCYALREAELFLAAGKRSAARAAAERRLAAAPRDPAARLVLARLLIRAGDIPAGRARAAELMERRAGDAAFWSALGELLLDLRDWPAAKRAAERGLANDPGNAGRAREILGMAELVGARAPARAPSVPPPAIRPATGEQPSASQANSLRHKDSA